MAEGGGGGGGAKQKKKQFFRTMSKYVWTRQMVITAYELGLFTVVWI